MTREEFDAYYEKEEERVSWERQPPDAIFLGLEIMRKYIPEATIEAAEHDIVYATSVDELLEAGITKEDVVLLLGKLNWHIEDYDSFAHFA